MMYLVNIDSLIQTQISRSTQTNPQVHTHTYTQMNTRKHTQRHRGTHTWTHGNTNRNRYLYKHRHTWKHTEAFIYTQTLRCTHTHWHVPRPLKTFCYPFSFCLSPPLSPFFFFFKFFLSSASSYWTNLSAISQGWISNQDRTFWKPPWASAYFCILLPFLSPTGVLLSECQPYLCLVGISECMQILGVLVKQLQMTTPRLLSPYLYIWSEPEAYLVIYAILFWDLLLSTKNTTLFLTPPAAEWHLCGH